MALLFPATLFFSKAVVAALPQEGGGMSSLLEFRPGAMIWTWVAFLVALPFMWKFIFGPISKALASRDQQMEDAIEAANEAQKKAEEQVNSAREELEHARVDARKMVQEATDRAERQAAQALDDAKEEAKRQLDKARQDIDAEKRRALLEIRREVVDLTIASTEKILRKDIDDDVHRQMVEDFLGGLEKVGN